MSATARIEIRVEPELKKAAERAVALSGAKGLTEYLTRLLERDTAEVMLAAQNQVLPNEAFDRFAAACALDAEPSAKLGAAYAKAKDSGLV